MSEIVNRAYRSPSGSSLKGQDTVDEQELWRDLTPAAWHGAVKGNSVFCELYIDTREQVMAQLNNHGFDCIIDVGCGTGDIVGLLSDAKVPCFAMDINEDFITFCKTEYGTDKVDFTTGDACDLLNWWIGKQDEVGKQFHKPFVMCCNNTLGIMPVEIRETVINQMRTVAGTSGRCMVTYWNGHFFPCGVKEFYMRNPQLCGKFELCLPYVDFQNRKMHTESGYVSEWALPEEIYERFESYGIETTIVPPVSITAIDPNDRFVDYPYNFVQEMVMGIAVLFSGKERGNVPTQM